MVRPFFLRDPNIIGELKRVIQMKRIDGDIAGMSRYEARDCLTVELAPAGIEIFLAARAVITRRPAGFVRPDKPVTLAPPFRTGPGDV